MWIRLNTIVDVMGGELLRKVMETGGKTTDAELRARIGNGSEAVFESGSGDDRITFLSQTRRVLGLGV